MHKGRLEAFSDGVIAILITIMVLELKVPHRFDLQALQELIPVFLGYVLSFVWLGIAWNNHHHLLQASHSVHGKVLWANHHLLFWLSLVPFTTAWMTEGAFEAIPVALYGANLLMAGFAFIVLKRVLINHHGNESGFAKAIGKDRKGTLTFFLYLIAIPLAFWNTKLSLLIYVSVAMIYFVPDKKLEKSISK